MSSAVALLAGLVWKLICLASNRDHGVAGSTSAGCCRNSSGACRIGAARLCAEREHAPPLVDSLNDTIFKHVAAILQKYGADRERWQIAHGGMLNLTLGAQLAHAYSAHARIFEALVATTE